MELRQAQRKQAKIKLALQIRTRIDLTDRKVS